MDRADVFDEQSLAAYLDELPDDERRAVGMRVAFRAAARILPLTISEILWATWAERRGTKPLDIFEPVVLAGVVADEPTAPSKPYQYLGNVDMAADLSEAAFAVSIAGDLAYEVYAARNHKFTGDALVKLIQAHAKSLEGVDVWHLIRSDLGGESKLWPSVCPPFVDQAWEAVAKHLKTESVDSSVWIHWYNRVLYDRDWYPEAMSNVLRDMEISDWEKGPPHVNPMFDEVLALYLEQDGNETASPERPIDNAAPQLEATRSAMVANRRTLPSSFDAILGLISLEIERLQGKNYQSDTERDEAKRQIGVLNSMHHAILGLVDLVPEKDSMPDDDAEKAVSLVQQYLGKYKEWPRENADEFVDGTYRLGLIGATALVLPWLGVSATAATVIGGALFGGERLLKNIIAAKQAI